MPLFCLEALPPSAPWSATRSAVRIQPESLSAFNRNAQVSRGGSAENQVEVARSPRVSKQ